MNLNTYQAGQGPLTYSLRSRIRTCDIPDKFHPGGRYYSTFIHNLSKAILDAFCYDLIYGPVTDLNYAYANALTCDRYDNGIFSDLVGEIAKVINEKPVSEDVLRNTMDAWVFTLVYHAKKAGYQKYLDGHVNVRSAS